MSVEELRESLLNEGYCFIEGVIPQDQVESIREGVARDVQAHSQLEPPSGYVPGFLRLNQDLVPYIAHEKILGLAESLFGPHVHISMVTGMVNGPGMKRGAFHADWPYNQGNAAHIPAPYPDCVLHLLSMWMLSDFTAENGATVIVPKSHKNSDHPREATGIDPMKPYPGERRLEGKAGTIGVFDCRMWHAVAPNLTNQNRVSVIVRYAPWWLNLDPLRPGTPDRTDIVDAVNGRDSRVPALPQEVFDKLPANVKPLLHYSVEKG